MAGGEEQKDPGGSVIEQDERAAGSAGADVGGGSGGGGGEGVEEGQLNTLFGEVNELLRSFLQLVSQKSRSKDDEERRLVDEGNVQIYCSL